MPISPTRVVASILTVLALVATLVVAATIPAQAKANAKDFNPGFLISDQEFFDGTALTSAEVDAFIKGMNKGCASGKTCIRNYKEDVTKKAATSKCKAIPAKKNQTAGQIIAAVGKACGINPKAILVILQKEQSLVTSTAPKERAFWYAMGAGCPDSTGCTTPYKGLYSQVYYGASLLKGYTIPGSTHYNRYAAGKTSNIQYHPSTSCGTKAVFVQNQATHALYVYTPYTPNKAALDNLYGKGNSCSAYGNRNFWRLYTDWWGDTGSAGAIAIDALYEKNGGSTGALGAKVGALVTSTVPTPGLYQEYKNGIIAWTKSNGAYVIDSTLYKTWKARVADFGWPTQATQKSTAEGGGTWQNFDIGLLARKGSGTVYTLWGLTRTLYIDNKGPNGPMGWPTAFQYLDEEGRHTQTFTNGTVYREAREHVGFLTAALVPEYERRGDMKSSLGWPVGLPTTTTASGIGGLWQSLDKGMLVDSDHGTFAVFGQTAKTFQSLGVAKTGWPIANRAYVGDTAWLSQDFEKGAIVVKGSTAGFMHSKFVSPWVSSGAVDGTIGKPTGNPIRSEASGGGVYQGFKHVALASKDGKSVYRLKDQMRIAWREDKYASGFLGWPISTPKKDSTIGYTVQHFENGVVMADSKKYGIVGGHQFEVARANGLGKGALGWPTDSVKKSSVGSGGEYQYFTAGTITWQEERGAFFVPKAIWSARTKVGGLAGLGWPIEAPKTDSKGKVTQKFEHATVSWTTSGGAVVTLTK